MESDHKQGTQEAPQTIFCHYVYHTSNVQEKIKCVTILYMQQGAHGGYCMTLLESIAALH